MAKGFTIKIQGDPNLTRKLNALPDAALKKVMRSSARVAMKYVAKGVSQRMPKATGTARKSLTVRAAKRSRKHAFKLMVLFKNRDQLLRPTKNDSGEGFFYPAALEYGVKGTRHRIFAPMRRTYREDKSEATRIATAQAAIEWKKVDRELAVKNLRKVIGV